MKQCEGCAENIQLYLGQRLYGQGLVEFRAHLELCAACRQELEPEEDLSRLLRGTSPLYFAPDGLRARVQQALGKPAPQPLPAVRPKRGPDIK
jgi:hypothetical protein